MTLKPAYMDIHRPFARLLKCESLLQY